jgi:NAD(P)-dependent dehydrogenase (short-subunit alcohol dehydrogenase family)
VGRLDGKVCFITGGASGMGRVAARLFCGEGARVAIADVSDDAGEAAAAEARAASGSAADPTRAGAENAAGARGGDAFYVACDVTDARAVEAAIGETVRRYGRLDVLYNNAGIMLEEDGSLLDTDDSVWDRTFAVNVRGIQLCCRYGIPELIRGGGGSVINIASFVALVGCSVPQDAYTASKGAVIALTKSLAVQFAPRGVRSNAICPGPIETPLMTEWLLKDPEAKRVRLARNPSGRFGRPEDIAALALHLASDESSWTNGAVLVVDGGITSNYF